MTARAELSLSKTMVQLLVNLAGRGSLNHDQYLRFRSDHEEDLSRIDMLESEGWIQRENNEYSVGLAALGAIRSQSDAVEKLLILAGTVYSKFRELYRQEPGRKLLLTEIAALVPIQPDDLRKVIVLMKHAMIFGGYSIDDSKSDSYVVLAERILVRKTFEDVIKEQTEWQMRRSAANLASEPQDTNVLRTAIDAYRLDGVLGEGGSGIVWRVSSSTDEILALKLLKPKSVTSQRLVRFRNEIRFGTRSVHPNIVRIYDVGTIKKDGVDTMFFVMPLYDKTLRDAIKEGLEPPAALQIISSLIAGLQFAHALGVVHRDLKPENIFLHGECGLIGDFGIAHFEEDAIFAAAKTRQGERLANFAYAAPEQRIPGQLVDSRADLFALGLILNEMFTREVPYGSGYRRISHVAPEFGHLDSLVEDLLQRDPEARPPLEAVQNRLLAASGDGMDNGRASSTSFFSERFANAFPGVRGITKFADTPTCIERLAVLLHDPLSIGRFNPIWWWRNGDLQIEQFRVLDESTILIDSLEFVMDFLYAVNVGAYYQQFVYLQFKPSSPTGLYSSSSGSTAEMLTRWEEYGIYRGHFVSRAEFDDGAAVINGKVVRFDSKPELRVRYTTPYNLVIAAHDSPINNGGFDRIRDGILDGMLRGTSTIDELAEAVRQLPKREY